VRRLTKASLWLINPTYAMWRDTKSMVSPSVEPFRRWNPKAMRWEALLIIAGAVTIGLTLRFGVAILFGVPILSRSVDHSFSLSFAE